MKKYIALFLAVLMLVFVGCTKTPEDTSTTDLDITTTEPESTTENVEPLSYDEYFSEVRPFELKRPDYRNDEYPDSWNDEMSIESCWSVGQSTNQYVDKGSYTSNPLKYEGEFREDRLYLVNYDTSTVEGFFSEYNIYHIFNKNVDEGFEFFNSDVDEHFCRKEGVYVIIDHNEFALLDYNGKKVKSIYTANAEIKDFYVLDEVAWLFFDGAVYRVYLPTSDVDKIIDGIDNSGFVSFYYPISNYEIEWAENTSDDKVCAHYFNAKTGEEKTRLSKPELGLKGAVSCITGWWFVPEDSYKQIEKLVCSLPEKLKRIYIDSQANDPGMCCGFVQGIKTISSTMGWISINYDFKPVFRDGKLVGVENIPSWYKLNDFVPFEGNDKIVTTDGEYAPYYEDFDNYRFAFVCESEDEPVYAVIIPKDACSDEDFEQVVKSIKIEK